MHKRVKVASNFFGLRLVDGLSSAKIGEDTGSEGSEDGALLGRDVVLVRVRLQRTLELAEEFLGVTGQAHGDWRGEVGIARSSATYIAINNDSTDGG
jgi:hypothetical protein